jgi:hypothetical protein
MGGSLHWALPAREAESHLWLAGCAAVLGRGYYMKGSVPDAPGRLYKWPAVCGVLDQLGIGDGDQSTKQYADVVTRGRA